MTWGGVNRPTTSAKLGFPTRFDGADGDTQIRNTNLGAKLFGKIAGEWYAAPLSKDSIMRIGSTISDHLLISPDKLEFMKNSTSMLSITNTGDINLTGKIVISSTGTQNVVIGTGNIDEGIDNVAIGVDAGSSQTGGQQNVFVGTLAGSDYTSSLANVCIGMFSGANNETGIGGIYIGGKAFASGSAVHNEIVIAGYTHPSGGTGKGANTVVLGNRYANNVYLSEDSTATVHCGAVVHGLTEVHLTDPGSGAHTLAYGTHSVSSGKYVTINEDAQTITLPAVQIGASFIIVNTGGTGYTLLTIDPNAGDKFLTNIAGGVGTDGNYIKNTKATQNKGDFVKLVGMSADGWAITEIGGIWADE